MPHNPPGTDPDDAALLQARGLERRYGEHIAVSGVNIALYAGHVLGLLGPNGAGKSTTLEMLSGNLQPHRGSVRVMGHDLARDPLEARRRLGYLPDQPPLYPELRVDEYLDLCATLHGLRGAHKRAARERVKRDCHLQDVGRQLIGRLSRGFRQRTGIAQALIHDPAVLILDEPTVGLDPIQIREIRALIRNLASARGIILSTHILPEVQAICSHVTVLYQGHMVHSGRLDALAGDDGHSWLLRFASPPDIERLQQLAGDGKVTPDETGAFVIDTERATLDAILAASATEGWELLEVRARGSTLEELFMQVTAGTAPPVGEGETTP